MMGGHERGSGVRSRGWVAGWLAGWWVGGRWVAGWLVGGWVFGWLAGRYPFLNVEPGHGRNDAQRCLYEIVDADTQVLELLGLGRECGRLALLTHGIWPPGAARPRSRAPRRASARACRAAAPAPSSPAPAPQARAWRNRRKQLRGGRADSVYQRWSSQRSLEETATLACTRVPHLF